MAWGRDVISFLSVLLCVWNRGVKGRGKGGGGGERRGGSMFQTITVGLYLVIEITKINYSFLGTEAIKVFYNVLW